jgi:hypothetical protein
VGNRWLSRRAFVLHFLLVTVVPGCLLAGWWQVHRALGGNLLSYFYSVEWPIFAVLGVVAWWQLIHDVPTKAEYENPRRQRRSFLHRDDEVPSPALVWDEALETPELRRYNQYLQALSAGGERKTWGNPRGLPLEVLYQQDSEWPGADQAGGTRGSSSGGAGDEVAGGGGGFLPGSSSATGQDVEPGTDRTDLLS